MTLLAIALMWIVGSLIMASEGDYSGLKIIGTVIMYIIIGGFFLWFLSVTGWAGLILFLFITVIIALSSGTKG